jgi:negative regulator of replication initiation
MAIENFLNIEIDEPPIELQLSVEMRIREVLKSDNYDDIKRYCTHLIRHQMKQDVFLVGVLQRVVELETLLARRELKEEKKTIDRLKKFFHI